MEKSENGDRFNVTFEGLARIRLPRSLPPVLSILPPHPLTISTFSLPLPINMPLTTNDLLPLAVRLVPKPLHDRMGIVPPSLLADILVTILGVSWETRAELLGVPDIEERVGKVKEILLELMSDRGIAPPSSPSKALITRSNANPLIKRTPRPAQAAPAQPQSSEDLQGLHNTFQERMDELSVGARQAVKRELGRLGGMQPQSAEYSLIRTYVEWLLALPWKRVSELDDDLDLEGARKKLDAEHEGLEAVKRRVVEYLAVYRSVSFSQALQGSQLMHQAEEGALPGRCQGERRRQAEGVSAGRYYYKRFARADSG